MPRDVALVRELVTGTLRWQGAIDGVVAPLCRVPLARLDVEVLTALRLGAYQLLYLDRVPASAVVDDAVALVRAAKKSSATGLVNAVLRRIARGERGAAPDHDEVDTLARIGVASRLAGPALAGAAHAGRRRGLAHVQQHAGADDLAGQPAGGDQPGRRGRGTRAPWRRHRRLPLRPTRDSWCAPAIRWAPRRSTAGACVLQDEGSQLAALVAPVRAGARVLDVCASPGGKTLAYLAAAGAEGYVVAADVRPRRVQLLADTLRRAHAARAGIVHIDADAALPVRAAFDVVAVDAPCSGLGTLRRDPDIKWRRTADDLPRLAARQLDLLRRASAAVGAGGLLIYTTCSSEADENEDVVARFLELTPAFTLGRADHGPDGARLAPFCDALGRFSTDPARHGLEAYFGVVLVREGIGHVRAAVVQ